MATEKLNKTEIADLQSRGIKGLKTKEEAREKMVEMLAKEGVDVEDDETYDEVYEMWDVMFPVSEAANDALAEEVAEEDEAEEEETEEDEEEKGEDFEAEVKKDVKKSKPAKTTAPKATKKQAEKKIKKSAKRLDPKNNEDDAKRYDALKKVIQALSPKDQFDFNFIANGGVTVKYMGDNSKRAFLSFDSPKTKGDKIYARTYIPSVRSEEVIKDIFGEDYVIKADWSGNFLVHDIEVSELVELIKNDSDKFKDILTTLGKKDEKLGKNRKKMIDDLQGKKTEAVEKVKTKKKSKPAPVEAEVEEVEEEAKPAKKAKKATGTKKRTATKTTGKGTKVTSKKKKASK